MTEDFVDNDQHNSNIRSYRDVLVGRDHDNIDCEDSELRELIFDDILYFYDFRDFFLFL